MYVCSCGTLLLGPGPWDLGMVHTGIEFLNYKKVTTHTLTRKPSGDLISYRFAVDFLMASMGINVVQVRPMGLGPWHGPGPMDMAHRGILQGHEVTKCTVKWKGFWWI